MAHVVPGGPVDKANALARDHEHDPNESAHWDGAKEHEHDPNESAHGDGDPIARDHEHDPTESDHADADRDHEQEPADKHAREPVVRSGDTLAEIHPGEPGMFDT